MDDLVTRAAGAALLAWGQLCMAQALSDPTRPPDAILMPRSAAPAADSAPAATGPRLQSVLIARHAGGRNVAVIDGKMVQVGDMVNGARVSAMRDNEVVLVRGNTRQVLTLFPKPAPRKAGGQG